MEKYRCWRSARASVVISYAHSFYPASATSWLGYRRMSSDSQICCPPVLYGFIKYFCRWECPDAPNVTANIICTACGGAGHIAKDCKNPRPGGGVFNLGDGGMDDEVYF